MIVDFWDDNDNDDDDDDDDDDDNDRADNVDGDVDDCWHAQQPGLE